MLHYVLISGYESPLQTCPSHGGWMQRGGLEIAAKNGKLSYFASAEKASNTFPAIAFVYPLLTYTMPLTMVGPAPLSEPPRASTPLVVRNGCAVSKSHSRLPSRAS